MQSAAYGQWLATEHGVNTDHADGGLIVDLRNSGHAMLCPDCGHILIKFKVGNGVDFCLDRCNACNGVWLDQHEWETLREQALHVELYHICTSDWQKQRHESEQRAWFDQTYDEKFGQNDYAEIKKVRHWLNLHPKKSDLLAYLTDPDPYQV
ncbi:MAG: zf-TFIIB domain-containing protein [bacterium]|nr:zf-TFIIB domain-containing protein [bacterium]